MLQHASAWLRKLKVTPQDTNSTLPLTPHPSSLFYKEDFLHHGDVTAMHQDAKHSI